MATIAVLVWIFWLRYIDLQVASSRDVRAAREAKARHEALEANVGQLKSRFDKLAVGDSQAGTNITVGDLTANGRVSVMGGTTLSGGLATTTVNATTVNTANLNVGVLIGDSLAANSYVGGNYFGNGYFGSSFQGGTFAGSTASFNTLTATTQTLASSTTTNADITAATIGSLTVTGPTAQQGQLVASFVPEGSAVNQGSVFINPATATASDTLLGLAVGGSQRLRVDASGNTSLAGNLTAGGTLGVTGTATLSGNLVVNGSATLGSNSSDTVTFNGLLASDIVPNNTQTLSLGAPTTYFKDIYVANVYANNLNAAGSTISGTTSDIFTINSDNASADTEDISLLFYRGTVSPNALLTWNATTDRFEFNQSVAVGGTLSATSLQGDGAGLTNLNASNIASGTVADARLTANVSLLGQTIGTTELEDLSVTNIKLAGAITDDKLSTIGTAGKVADSALSNNVALLGGRAGGQLLQGGTAAGENLTLSSTAHATKGKLLLGTSAYDEVNNRLGIGTASPGSLLQLGSDAGTTASGITFGSTGDTNLYRSAANELKTDDVLIVGGSSGGYAIKALAGGIEATTSTGSGALLARTTGDANSRFTVHGSGNLNWGNGTAATDTNLYRSAANTLKTDDMFIAAGGIGRPDGAGVAFNPGNGSHTLYGTLLFDTAGGGFADTNLYRSATNTLATDGKVGANYTTALGAAETAYLFNASSGSNNASSLVLQVRSGGTDRLVVNANTGNVGIGTTSPSAKLDVQGNVNQEVARFQGATDSSNNRSFISLYNTNPGYWWEFSVQDPSGGATTNGLAFRERAGSGASVERLFIASGGNVGIGTTGPNDKLDVAGDIRVGTSGTNGCIKRFDGGAIVGTCSSDERLKKNIQSLDSVLDNFGQLNVVNYDWRADEFPDYHFGTSNQTGLIAQDVEALFPQLVHVDANGYKALDYTGLGILNIKATTELNAKTNGIDQRVTALEQQGNPAGQGGSNFADLNVSGTATINNLTVAGVATVQTLNVIGSAQFSGDITVAGDIVLGQDRVGKNVGVTGTAHQVVFGGKQRDADYAVQVSPSWATKTWITDKTTDGFTIHYEPAPTSATIDWLIFR